MAAAPVILDGVCHRKVALFSRDAVDNSYGDPKYWSGRNRWVTAKEIYLPMRLPPFGLICT
jgi:hypothetical protein